MVLYHRPHPKLLPLRPLRPHLEIPLVLATRSDLVCRPPVSCLLYTRLGHHTLGVRQPVKTPLLDPPDVCGRPGCPEMVPDAVGDVRDGFVGTVGGKPSRWGTAGADTVVVVGGAGRGAGGWVWDDTTSNPHAIPHRLHIGMRASVGQCGYDRRPSLRARCRGAGRGFPELGAQLQGVGERVVLDRAGVPAEYLRGVL